MNKTQKRTKYITNTLQKTAKLPCLGPVPPLRTANYFQLPLQLPQVNSRLLNLIVLKAMFYLGCHNLGFFRNICVVFLGGYFVCGNLLKYTLTSEKVDLAFAIHFLVRSTFGDGSASIGCMVSWVCYSGLKKKQICQKRGFNNK